MPYEIAKVNGKYLVRKKTDKKKVFGTHPTYEKALAQLRAIEVNTHEHANLPDSNAPVSKQQFVAGKTPGQSNFNSLPGSQGKRVEVRKG